MSRSRGFSAAARMALGDFVEHHPLDGNARLQRLQQVPRDGFTLAVTVGGQVELVDVLQEAFEFGDRALLSGLMM